MSRPSREPLLTVSDVAARLKNSTRTIWRNIAENRIAVVRFGRSVRITEEALLDFIGRHGSTRRNLSTPDKNDPSSRED
jgi:excisionase family DNA binding protein